jgi:alpha-D-ribose 1-methylphosphonate 5-triphosphate diphosphatase PhnM
MTSRDYVVHDVVAVLPDRLREGATITVAGGVIVAIETGVAAPTRSIDGRGAFCLPGLVDTHSDGLEKELRPRPGVVLDPSFALRSFESRVRSAAVTTVYHGIGFEEDGRYDRTVELASVFSDAVEQRRASVVCAPHSTTHMLVHSRPRVELVPRDRCNASDADRGGVCLGSTRCDRHCRCVLLQDRRNVIFRSWLDSRQCESLPSKRRR